MFEPFHTLSRTKTKDIFAIHSLSYLSICIIKAVIWAYIKRTPHTHTNKQTKWSLNDVELPYSNSMISCEYRHCLKDGLIPILTGATYSNVHNISTLIQSHIHTDGRLIIGWLYVYYQTYPLYHYVPLSILWMAEQT